MRRSPSITWDQLRVGLVIGVAVLVLGVAIYKLGQAANLFAKRYQLIAYLPDANGIREGGSVMVAGQLAGTVKKIEFLPVDADTTRNLRLTLAVDAGVREQIRRDSRGKLRTMGLLGDKVFDITPGTPRTQPLKDGDTFEIADVRMEFLLRDEAVDAPPSRLWIVVLVVVGIVLAAYVIYRLRG